MNNSKGFTLVELLAIITILGIILVIAIPAFQHHVTSARNEAYDTLITTSRTAAQNKYMDEGLPAGCQKYNIEEDLYKKGYMDKPADPASTSTNCNGYVYVKSDNTLDSIENYKILVSLGCSTYKKDVCKDSGGEACTFSEEEKNECGYENISGHDGPVTPDTPEPTNPPMIKVTSNTDRTTFRNDTYRENIKTITLDNHLNPPSNIIESWDIGVNQNGDVMAYITKNSSDDTMYNLYIQGDGSLYANVDSSYLFFGLKGLDSISGLNKLNTSKTTSMRSMFYDTGYKSTVFTLDLGNNFDTSNVTDMISMFHNTGYNSKVFTLNLGNKFDTSKVTNMTDMFSWTGRNSNIFSLNLGDKFDTSKVTSMSGMFSETGSNCANFTLDLGDKFNTSNVTTMSSMFMNTGYNSTIFALDLGNKFDTSKVMNMRYMFFKAGYKSQKFTLDLGDKFDTSNVSNMYYMFGETGYFSPIFTLDLGNKFNTGKVTTMEGMFMSIGSKNTNFTLDLGDKFDTKKVTSMGNMFLGTGHNSTVFTLNLGNKFDTSNVTNINGMFYNTGKETKNLVLDLSTFNFDKVTIYDRIFYGMTTSKKIYVKNSTAQNWIINNSGNSNLTTSNVLIKS